MLVGDDYVEAAGVPVAVADTVGAGDAFAAAFVHGLVAGWPAATIADFANRAGAAVAAVRGAIPAR
jgi:sugar/nucleoside kinase (ribokinase family)